jgi:Na+(H+)/acetate symporter ActP
MILFVGVLVFVFFQFNPSPVFFNAPGLETARHSAQAPRLAALEQRHADAFNEKSTLVRDWIAARHGGDEALSTQLAALVAGAEAKDRAVRDEARALVHEVDPLANTKDSDYVFLTFVMTRLPVGLIGLLLAVILCAAMSATASALTALSTTTMVDFYRRSVNPTIGNDGALRLTRWFTAGWGLIAIGFAIFASRLDNLIQAVNILGSIFYGPMLGVFLVGFFLKRVRATPVFWATLLAQALVIAVFATSEIGFLWYNVIGCAAVFVFALAFNAVAAKDA